MVTVNVHEAKTNLSRLLAQSRLGRTSSSPATASRWRGWCVVQARKAEAGFHGRAIHGSSDSFFDPLPEEELAAWEGRGDEKLKRSGNDILS